MQNNKRLQLKDIITLNPDFVTSLKSWDFTSVEPENNELNEAIQTLITGMNDQFLLEGLQASDQIGPENALGIFSFLTPTQLGISLTLPYYAGDHVTLTKDYSQLKDYINTKIEWELPE